MSQIQTQAKPASTTTATAPHGANLLQRKCACGGSAGLTGECEECQKEKLLGTNGGRLQTKLAISEPGDQDEQEADRLAEQVMRMLDSTVNTKTPSFDETALVQRRMPGKSAAGIGTAPSIVQHVLSSPGQPLDAASRAFFEPRFGHHFGQVRVHADAKAAESAQALNALAYTVGRDVVFGRGQYKPTTPSGRQLLAHELTHVVQQQALAGMREAPALAYQPRETPARDAEQTSRKVVRGASVQLRTPFPDRIQRSVVDVAVSDGGGGSAEHAVEGSPLDADLQTRLENVYLALAEILTYYETKEAGWVEGVERLSEDALGDLSHLRTALGRKAIETNRQELYQLQSRYDLVYFDLKSMFDNLARAASPELAPEIVPTTLMGQAIGILQQLRPWWEELGLAPDSPVIEAIASTLPELLTNEVQYNNYLALFVEGFEKGLGQDIGEAGIALAKRHLRSSVALAVFQPIYLAGMVKGIYDMGAQIFAELERFLQDPQAFVSESIESIKAMLSLPAEQIAYTLGESTGQSIRETIDHLKDQSNAYTYIFELGKVMGPIVAGVIIEIIFSKGVGWLAGKMIAGVKKIIEKMPSMGSLRGKYSGQGTPEAKPLETGEQNIEGTSSTAAPGSSVVDVPPTTKGLSRPFTVLGETHHLSLVVRNGRLVIQLCSDGCGELIKKIVKVQNALQADSEGYQRLEELLRDASRYQRRWELRPGDPPLEQDELQMAADQLQELEERFTQVADSDPQVARAVLDADKTVTQSISAKSYIGWAPEDAIMDYVPIYLKETREINRGDYLEPKVADPRPAPNRRLRSPDPDDPDINEQTGERWFVDVQYRDGGDWTQYSVNYAPVLGRFGRVKVSTGSLE